MPIQFQCQSCRCTLRVPDYLAGRKVRCPKCRGVADVGPAPNLSPAPARQSEFRGRTSPAPPSQPLPDPEEVRVRAHQLQAVPEPEVEDAEEVEDRPSRPLRSKSRRQEAISTRPLRRIEPTEAEDEEDEEARRPRRLKRRKRRRREMRSSPANWSFLWWLVAGAIYLVVGAGTCFYMVATGHADELLMDGIGWAVMMPVSTIILIGSMFVGSAIAGGIDFGDARTAIPKALFLLAPINFITMVFPWYVSMFLTLPFWIIGLIVVFGLDLWETFFLMTVNWFLSLGAKVLVFLIVVAMLHGATMRDKERAPADDQSDDQIGAPFQKDSPDLKGRFGR